MYNHVAFMSPVFSVWLPRILLAGYRPFEVEGQTWWFRPRIRGVEQECDNVQHGHRLFGSPFVSARGNIKTITEL